MAGSRILQEIRVVHRPPDMLGHANEPHEGFGQESRNEPILQEYRSAVVQRDERHRYIYREHCPRFPNHLPVFGCRYKPFLFNAKVSSEMMHEWAKESDPIGD
jgi:hypothetical protein